MGSSEGSAANFGLLIAYILPGFTALRGLPFLGADPAAWGASSRAAQSIGGFLSGTVEATAVGLTVSTVRWLVIDTIHHRTGVRPPAWNFARLADNSPAFELLIQIHYRYYQFYGNMVIALVWAYLAGGYVLGWAGEWYWMLAGLFFAGSRDALRKYYARAGQLLGDPAEASSPDRIGRWHEVGE